MAPEPAEVIACFLADVTFGGGLWISHGRLLPMDIGCCCFFHEYDNDIMDMVCFAWID